MASEFQFNRRVNAGQTFESPQSATCLDSEAWSEVEVVLDPAIRQDPNMHLRVTILTSPDGTVWSPNGGGCEIRGTNSVPPEVLTEWLATNPSFRPILPPAGWRIKPRIQNLGSVNVQATYIVRTIDGIRQVIG